MIGIGDSLPAARVWLTTDKGLTLDQLLADGPFLLLFYLFDWSST